TVTVTDVTLRKREPLELEENLPLPDSLPEPERILRCSVTLVENHKQINRDKAVVSGTAYYTIMYQPKGEDAVTKELGTTTKEPVLFQAKSEFTQFVPLGRKNESGEGRIFFRVTKASAEPRDNESGIKNTIRVKVEGETFLEVYREVERRLVTDAYHPKKELVFDTETVELMQLGLCGISETTVREVINIPERISGIQRLTYLSGDVVSFQSKIEHGKNVVEGKAEVRLVGLSDEEKPTPFDMVRQLPFRIALDLPAGLSNPAAAASPLGAATAPPAASLPDNDVVLKELRCDRLNDRQVEVNAVIQMNGAVIRKKQCPLIRNVGFVEETGPQQERPGLVLYISRRGDTLWNIARKYRTTMEAVASINQIPMDGLLEAGTKLLIVK
ncbi:MAG: LysM peptidoglycan-binding domain-containing protein, partial [Firmicutes bacterium]|nr:LysM peptidoglycan-binding domain-containing protein [Bacillota bacterium]